MSRPSVFLSAGVPDPRRADRYASTSDPVAIGAALAALVYVTLGRRVLVWGGHPAITPMIWAAAEDMGVDYGNWVHLYQSRFFEEDFPAENARFRNVTYVDPVGADRDASLAEMRRRMLSEWTFEAGVFIGGMEGIEQEHDLFGQMHPTASKLPIASTGGAALLLYQRQGDPRSDLATSLDYVGMFHRHLSIPPTEHRHLGAP